MAAAWGWLSTFKPVPEARQDSTLVFSVSVTRLAPGVRPCLRPRLPQISAGRGTAIRTCRGRFGLRFGRQSHTFKAQTARP